MEFIQIVGKLKVKSKVKGVYNDQYKKCLKEYWNVYKSWYYGKIK